MGHTIGTYGTDYQSRAFVAYGGLGANLREDAMYPSAAFDANGNPLTGASKYVIHFDKGKTPPAKAFWSLTMYDPDGYMVANPINRNAIGDRVTCNIMPMVLQIFIFNMIHREKTRKITGCQHRPVTSTFYYAFTGRKKKC